MTVYSPRSEQRRAEIKTRLGELLAEAKAIESRSAAGKALNGDDSRVSELFKEAEALKNEHDDLGSLRTQLHELSVQIGATEGSPLPTHMPGQSHPLTLGRAGALAKAGLTPHTAWGGEDWGAQALQGRVDIHGKALIAPGEPLPVALPRPPIVTMEAPVTVLRALLDTATAAGGSYRWLLQNLRQNAAAVVPVGQLKPTSKYGLEWRDGRVSVIAHLSEPLNKYDLADSPALAAFLSGEMRLGIEQALEQAILAGPANSGFVGLLNTDGIGHADAAGTPLDSIRTAMGDLEAAGNTVDAIVTSPADWRDMELAKDAQGRYLLDAGPVDRATQRLWGRPVVVCPALNAGVAIVGDFRGSAALVVADGGGVALSYSEQTGETFQRNEIVWRAEVRAGFAVTRPSAFTAVTLATSTGNGGTDGGSTRKAKS